MAGPGRAPKTVLSRPNDQARREAASVKVASDGTLLGPDLPAGNWPDRTKEWWDGLRRSPMARAWIAADWDTLLDTALLHAEMWSGNLAVASELRLRMSQFGTNPESRLRLKIIVDSEAEQAKAVAPAIPTDRRRRLLKAVGDGS